MALGDLRSHSLAALPRAVPDPQATRIRDFLVELCADLAPDFVVIDGWAAFAHGSGQLLLDGDAFVSYPALGTLRDLYEVTPNHRMKKEQFRGPTGRHLPSRQYSAVAPSFDALMEGLAWEAREWIAIEAWRAQRKG